MGQSNRASDHAVTEQLRQHLRSTNTAKQFGFALADAGPGWALLRMRVGERHKQPHGVVHGGVLAALVDTAGGMAIHMSRPELGRTATIELKINYLEAVAGGHVFAQARVIRLGAHIAVVDCDVHDDNGRPVAKALMTFYVGPFKKGRTSRRR